MTRRLPVVSYSASGGRDVIELSRRLGFTTHVKAPLSPADLDDHLAPTRRRDLFTWIGRNQRGLRARLEKRETLLDLVRAASSTLEPRKIAESLLDRMSNWVPAACWAVVAMRESGEVATLADSGVSTLLGAGLNDVAHWIMESGEAFMSANLTQDRRLRSRAVASVIGVPLVCRAQTVGAVIAAEAGSSASRFRLTPDLTAALQATLEAPAFALHSTLRLQRAEGLSVTDDLTQLYNSRYLNQVLHRETKRATRSGRPLSLLFLDLDGFKTINDNHGHLFGSRALVEAAHVLRMSARETDICVRFGGDEFAVVLPDTGTEGALAVGERVRQRLAAHHFLGSEGLNIRLTASVGIATLPGTALSADELLKAADGAMYRVKEAGKNGILVAFEEAVPVG